MRLSLVALSLGACALVASGCTSRPSPQGDPDPGHTRSGLLRAVAGALPTNALTRDERLTPSRWDACDGMSWSYGWDPIYFDVDFTTTTASEALTREVASGLARMGWRIAPPFGGPGGNWVRTLPGGATANANLGRSQSRPGQWYLHASAPPAVHPVTGC